MGIINPLHPKFKFMKKIVTYLKFVFKTIIDPGFHAREIKRLNELYENDVNKELKKIKDETILMIQGMIDESDINGFVCDKPKNERISLIKSEPFTMLLDINEPKVDIAVNNYECVFINGTFKVPTNDERHIEYLRKKFCYEAAERLYEMGIIEEKIVSSLPDGKFIVNMIMPVYKR